MIDIDTLHHLAKETVLLHCDTLVPADHRTGYALTTQAILPASQSAMALGGNE